jgi:Tetratricopeptide repeat
VKLAYEVSSNEYVFVQEINGLLTSFLYDTRTKKVYQVGGDIGNYKKFSEYKRYRYKDIDVFELQDGTKLFDTDIDFLNFEFGRLSDRARDFRFSNNYSEAIRLYQECLKLKPGDPNTYLLISNCYKENNQFSDALYWVNKAINEDSEFNSSYYTNRISIFEKQGNKAAMASDYYTIGENSTDYSLFYYNKAISTYAYSNYSYDAIRVADLVLKKYNSIKKDDNLFDIYFARAYAKTQLGQYTAAISDYNIALKCGGNKENRAILLDNIGICYLNLNNKPMYCKYFKEACALGRCSNTWRCR